MRHLGARCADQLVAAGSARQRLRDLLKCAWPAVLRTAAGPLDALTRRAAMAVSTDPERIVAMGYDAFAAAVREELPHWGSTAATCAFCARSNRLPAILAASPPSGPQPVSGPPTHSMTGATPWASSPTSSPAWSRSSGRSGAKSGDHTHGAMRIRRRTLPQGEWEVLITDHHCGFIDWGTYHANQARKGGNIRPMAHQPGTGAVREGYALLQGLATCGTCGRKLAVYYDGPAKSTPGYHCTGTGQLVEGRTRHLRVGLRPGHRHRGQ